jgi:hypothetical protein
MGVEHRVFRDGGGEKRRWRAAVGLAHTVLMLVALEAKLEARAASIGDGSGGTVRWNGDSCR